MRVGIAVWARWEVRCREPDSSWYEVRVWDRSSDHVRAVVALGAQAAATPEEIVVAWTPCWSCLGRRRGEGDKPCADIPAACLRRSSSRCRRSRPPNVSNPRSSGGTKGPRVLACRPWKHRSCTHGENHGARKRIGKTYTRVRALLDALGVPSLRRTDRHERLPQAREQPRLSHHRRVIARTPNVLRARRGRSKCGYGVADRSLRPVASSKIQQLHDHDTRHASRWTRCTRICFSRAMPDVSVDVPWA